MQELILGVGGILFNTNRQVLVVTEDEDDRRYDKRAGQISIPMGKLDGQPPKEALEREFLEETNAHVCVVRFLDEYRIPGDPGALANLYIVELIQETTLGGPGTLAPRWISIDDLLAMPEEAVRLPTKPAVQLALRILQRV